MKRIIQVTLRGHAHAFSLQAEADAALQAYLDRARLRLADDPDRDEVLGDIEQAIAEKLNHLPGAADRVFSRAELASVLDAIGAVDAGNADDVATPAPSRQRRRLCKIRQGRCLAGICQGLAVYSSIHVGWVRTIVVALSMITVLLATILGMSNFALTFVAWLPVLIYIALMFILPVADTRDAWRARHGSHSSAT